MVLINIFRVLLLIGVFHNTTGVPRRYGDEGEVEILQENEALSHTTENIRSIGVTYIYEINEKTELSSPTLRDRILQAVEELNNNLLKRRIKFTTKDIRPFINPGKPLAKYTAKELSRFLKSDSYFEKRSTNTDSTQIIAFGGLFDIKLRANLRRPKRYRPRQPNHFLISNFVNQPLAATTYKDICSKESKGIIIVRDETAKNIADLLSFNLACAAGIYDKQACQRGLSLNDMESFRCKYDQYCFLSKLGWYDERNLEKIDNVCKKDETHDPVVIKDQHKTDDVDDESESMRIIYMALAVLAGIGLLFPVPIVIYLWIDRKNTKKLTKNRVSVNYKYDPITNTGRPSIITDPKVTNDLQ